MPRPISILIVTLVTLMTQFAAADEPSVDTWFADYDELAAMTEPDRKAYLAEMRNILVGYEYNTYDSLGDYAAAMNVFSALVPEAVAAPASSASAQFCGPGERWQQIKSDQFCVVNQRPNAKGQCPDGSDVLANTNAGRGFETYRDLCYTKRESAEGGVEKICGKGFAVACETIKKTNKVECKCQPDGTAPVKPAVPADPKPAKPASAKPAPEKPAPASPAPPKETPVPVAHPAKGAPLIKDTPPKPPTPPAAAVRPACRALIPKCDESATHNEFFLKKRACVYAGNISKYRHKKPAKGDCEPVTKITLGEKLEYGCTEGVACNPLVFCVPKIEGSAAYCSKTRGQSTARCDKIAPNKPDCLNKLLKSVPRETWNAFLKNLKQVCSIDQASASYHCKECSIMYRRIFALNAQYTKSLCSGGSGAPKGAAKPPGSSAPTPAPSATPSGQ